MNPKSAVNSSHESKINQQSTAINISIYTEKETKDSTHLQKKLVKNEQKKKNDFKINWW